MDTSRRVNEQKETFATVMTDALGRTSFTVKCSVCSQEKDFYIIPKSVLYRLGDAHNREVFASNKVSEEKASTDK